MEAVNSKEYITKFLWISELCFLCSMLYSFIRPKRAIFTFLLFQHILEIDHGREYNIVLRRWVREDWREGTLSNRMCGWINYACYCCKRWNVGSIVNGRLIFILSQSLQSLLFSKFILLHDKSISSSGENISCILPLSPNLPIFINSWQGRILSSGFWFCDETVGFFLSLSGTFWQIKHSSSFEGFGLGISCTTLDGPGVFSYMFVLVRLS